MDYQPVNTEDFNIPETLVGLVIGRGGESIKRLQADSGCKIRIAQDNNGTTERTCTLTGSQYSIDEAKRMLSDVVQRGLSRQQNPGSYQPRQQQQQYYGGGGGQGGYNNGGGYNRYQQQ